MTVFCYFDTWILWHFLFTSQNNKKKKDNNSICSSTEKTFYAYNRKTGEKLGIRGGGEEHIIPTFLMQTSDLHFSNKVSLFISWISKNFK